MRSGGSGASPGNLSLLLLIVKAVALVLLSNQDIVALLDRPRLIGKLSLYRYRWLLVISPDWSAETPFLSMLGLICGVSHIIIESNYAACSLQH